MSALPSQSSLSRISNFDQDPPAKKAGTSVVDNGAVGNQAVKISDDQIVEYAPADSRYGWIIVTCAAFNLMCTLGIVNSFGVFTTYYINYIYAHESAASVAWIGTMVSAVMLGGSVTTGPLTDRFGFRKVALTGTVICCIALVLASFTTQLWQLVLTQGILFGIGASLIFSPSISLPAQWHIRYRAIATGLTVAGSGAGGMIFTELTQRMMDTIGYRWTLRALALMLVGISGISGSFYKRRISVPRGGIDFRAIVTDPRLIVVGLAGLFVYAGYFVPWYYLPTAALEIGETTQSSNKLVLYMNASSTVGRVLAAYAAVMVGPINSVALAYLVCSVLTLVIMVVVRSMAGYVVLSVVFGGLSASCVSIAPLVLTNIFGVQAVTTAMGIVNLWCAVGVLIGNPSQGAVYQRFDRPYHSFTAIAIWGFVGLALASGSYLMLKVIIIRGTPKRIWSRL
ncbi:MFS general substrate transporter [Linderina pennispora]|uniref:MFS general substrate transporter n=1 Tax=Linderina pennispora TaxID=61395 RepID=A0A1Y1W8N7_9FUNG|nr:MFS general substrate transporter [Linderina pennispora]ORX69901.1 MFS general substrate transporter [Linderina pennispora]